MTVKRLFFTFLTALALSTPAAGAIDGSWRVHQAFDQTVSRIIDSGRYTYILSHAMSLRQNSAPYNVGRPVLFRIDKEDPSGEWKALPAEFRLSGTFIDDAIYNPAGNFLIVAYDNGAIDLIYDSGELVRVDDMLFRNGMENHKVNQITLDTAGGRAFFATATGYFIVNLSTASVEKVANLGFECQWAAPCRGYIMVVDNDKNLLRAPEGNATTPGSFTPFIFDKTPSTTQSWLKNGQPVGIEALMPLTANTFAFIAKGTATNQYILAGARFDGTSWETGTYPPTQTAQTNFEITPANWLYKCDMYSNALSNRNGYLVKTNNHLVQLLRDTPTEGTWEEYSLRAAVVRERRVAERNIQAGSWDFNSFLFYVPRKSLYAASASGTGTDTQWTDTRDFGRPSAPLSGITNTVSYIPGYGIATASYGYTPFFGGVDPQIPANLSWYRNGKWTPLAAQINKPDWASDSKYATAYNRFVEYYPTNNPTGLTPDPDRPGFVYCGSVTHGITRFDLSDPDAYILRMNHTADEGKTLPGWVEMAPQNTSWNKLCSFSAPEFDTYGNMWSMRQNPDNKPGALEIWYWPAEARRQSANANNDPAAFQPWKHILVPTGFNGANQRMLLPVTIKGAENILFFGPNSQDGPWVAYDHNGTPDDTSDDHFNIIRKFGLTDGGSATIGYIAYMVNDPWTDRVWIGGGTGVHTIDPRTGVDGIKMEIPSLTFRDEPGRRERFFEQTASRAMAIDNLGRKWIGTSGLGVAVVSTDGTAIESIFDTSNSPLPSNTIVGIACDHETGIVMISTDRSLVEFAPGGLATYTDGAQATAIPSTVRPGSHTPVNLTGLPSGCDILVKDTLGHTVRNLGRSISGTMQWDTFDSTGERCPTGTYTIHAGDTGEPLATIRYMR